MKTEVNLVNSNVHDLKELLKRVISDVEQLEKDLDSLNRFQLRIKNQSGDEPNLR